METSSTSGLMSSLSESKSGRLVHIEFLRFIACLLVMLFHGYNTLLAMDSENTFFKLFTYFGFAGVDIFFVISGYIIFYTNTKTTTTRQNFSYLYKRLARIFLGYWPFFFLMLGAAYLFFPSSLQHIDYINSFFLVPDRLEEKLLTVSWTLSHELYFYLLLFFLLFSRYRFFHFSLLAIGLVIYNIFIYKTLDAYTFFGFKDINSLNRFIGSPWLLEFYFGALVAQLHARNINRFPTTAVIAGLALFIFTCYLSVLFDDAIKQIRNLPLRILFFGGSSALMIYGLASLPAPSNKPYKYICLYGGGASYAVYLLHTIVFKSINLSGGSQWLAKLAIPELITYIIILLTIVLLSIAIHRWIEWPLYQWAKSKNPFHSLNSSN